MHTRDAHAHSHTHLHIRTPTLTHASTLSHSHARTHEHEHRHSLLHVAMAWEVHGDPQETELGRHDSVGGSGCCLGQPAPPPWETPGTSGPSPRVQHSPGLGCASSALGTGRVQGWLGPRRRTRCMVPELSNQTEESLARAHFIAKMLLGLALNRCLGADGTHGERSRWAFPGRGVGAQDIGDMAARPPRGVRWVPRPPAATEKLLQATPLGIVTSAVTPAFHWPS